MREPRLVTEKGMPVQEPDVLEGENFLSKVREFRERAKHLSEKAQDDRGERFNEGRQDVRFKRGDLVVIKSRPSKGKLSLRYSGPYLVLSRFTDDYVIEAQTGGKKVKTAHVSLLKPYTDMCMFIGNQNNKDGTHVPEALGDPTCEQNEQPQAQMEETGEEHDGSNEGTNTRITNEPLPTLVPDSSAQAQDVMSGVSRGSRPIKLTEKALPLILGKRRQQK